MRHGFVRRLDPRICEATAYFATARACWNGELPASLLGIAGCIVQAWLPVAVRVTLCLPRGSALTIVGLGEERPHLGFDTDGV